MQYATQRLIDSVWTVGYEIKDDMVVIHSYDRDNPIGYEKERELPQALLMEDDDRTVTSIFINEEYDHFRMDHSKGGKEYVVANPKHVFSYNVNTPPEITVKPAEPTVIDPTESQLYLDKVKVTGVSISSTAYKATIASIKGNMQSSLFDAVYNSLKQKNIMTPDELTDLARKTVESVDLKVNSSEVKESKQDADAYLQRITVEISQSKNVKTPMLTEDVLEATNDFQSNHPKPWVSFDAVDMKPAAPKNDAPEVRTPDSVREELTAKLDPKYTVSVTDQQHDAFLVEIHNEHNLVECLPSYQPNFEERYAIMLNVMAPPKPMLENEDNSPSFKR